MDDDIEAFRHIVVHDTKQKKKFNPTIPHSKNRSLALFNFKKEIMITL